MELFFCDQCEKRIDSNDVAQAKSAAAANSDRMLCLACRPKAAISATRTTVRLEKKVPSAGVPNVREVRAAESGSARRAVGSGFSATRLQPQAAIALPAEQVRSNMQLKIGIVAGGVCLMAALALAFSGNGSHDTKKDVAQNQPQQPAPPPPSLPPPPPATPKQDATKPLEFKLSKTDPAPQSKSTTVAAGVRDIPLLNVTYWKGDTPTIDGNLDDAAWKDAAVVDATKLEMGGTAKQKVRLFMTRSDTSLFIGVQCFEDEAALKSLKATATANMQDNTWEDDSVEFFLDPTNKRQQYYHIVVNSKGYHWDVFDTSPGNFDKTWKSQVVAAARVGKDSWNVEMAIPFACLDRSDTFDSEWAFNILHTRTAANELIYWSPVMNRSSHRPERFGRLNGMPKK